MAKKTKLTPEQRAKRAETMRRVAQAYWAKKREAEQPAPLPMPEPPAARISRHMVQEAPVHAELDEIEIIPAMALPTDPRLPEDVRAGYTRVW